MQRSNDNQPEQQGVPSLASSPSHRRSTVSSSYVSTLSHALNITTPTSARKATPTSPPQPQTAASLLSHATPTSHLATPAQNEALRTPTRHTHAPQLLTLSGHEAFNSPGTPVSPWAAAPLGAVESGASTSSLVPSASHLQQARAPVQDQEWLMSGSSTQKTFNIFHVGSKAHYFQVAAHPPGSSVSASKQTLAKVASMAGPTTASEGTDAAGVTETQSGAFRAYREHPGSESRISIYESAPSDNHMGMTMLSPSSNASLSPIQLMSAFPTSFNDGAFLTSIFEQETPSLSTHQLPSSDLTDQLRHQDARFLASQHSSDDVGHPPIRTGQHVLANRSQAVTEGEALARVFLRPMAPSTTSAHLNSPPTLAVREVSEGHLDHKIGGSEGKPSFHAQRQANLAKDDDLGILEQYHHNRSFPSKPIEEEQLSGLGLDLELGPAPSARPMQLSSASSTNANGPHMLVDEMGRWLVGSDGSRSSSSDMSSHPAAGLYRPADRWHRNEPSYASLGATTERSFTSASNSSTWDTSFKDIQSSVRGPSSASADDESDSTPASSIGLSHNRSLAADKPAAGAMGQLLRSGETPEVAMHDFSEFGQSVSIEQMAEERWRTWPRNRDAVVSLRDRASTPALPLSPEASLSVQAAWTDERTSLDSLSISSSSTRSRLLAEPYNKNMRSARPSSSASTSSRSSVGNLASQDSQTSSGTTGPTRPRSYIASGSLRMSMTTRTGSSGGLHSDAGVSASERVSGTALALRRAREMSQAGMSPSGASASSMKLTRSSDALLSPNSSLLPATNVRHSIALQRTAKSSEGTSIGVRRPQSAVEPAADLESLRTFPSLSSQCKGKIGFNEVSVALDTLRTFLQQKPKGDTKIPGEASASVDARSLTGAESPSKPGRTLRRTKGILPPRGVSSSVDEFGTLQPSSLSQLHSGSGELSRSLLAHARSQSMGGPMMRRESSPDAAFSRQDDRLAVLEDLSERVLKLQAESERQKEQQAAATMPPPPARPASMVAQQRDQGSSMTRREMHEEYLRKRSGAP